MHAGGSPQRPRRGRSPPVSRASIPAHSRPDFPITVLLVNRLVCLLLALSLSACSSGPDLQMPEGMSEFELREVVTEFNPLWDPVERAVTDVRLLEGRRLGDDRYELDAEYEVLCVAKREPMRAEELELIGRNMRAQGREQEWLRLEAQRKAAEALLAERVGDMTPGEKRWFRDTFVLVRVNETWMPEHLAARMREDQAAARR